MGRKTRRKNKREDDASPERPASEAPFQFTRAQTARREPTASNSAQFTPPCATRDAVAAEQDGQGPYALRVRVEPANKKKPIPHHLWTNNIVGEILETNGLPPAHQVVILGDQDFIWFREDHRTGRGIDHEDARRYCELLVDVDGWFREDVKVFAVGTRVTLPYARRIVYDAIPTHQSPPASVASGGDRRNRRSRSPSPVRGRRQRSPTPPRPPRNREPARRAPPRRDDDTMSSVSSRSGRGI